MPAAQDWPTAPTRTRRVTVDSLRRQADPAAAVRAAGSMLQFVAWQQAMLREQSRSRAGMASTRRRAIDPRLWLDDRRWIAWTTCGELVSVGDIEPGSR